MLEASVGATQSRSLGYGGIGRLLRPADERPGAEPVIVLTEPFWALRFSADESIVGRTIRLDGEPYTVVGVLASGFALSIRVC